MHMDQRGGWDNRGEEWCCGGGMCYVSHCTQEELRNSGSSLAGTATLGLLDQRVSACGIHQGDYDLHNKHLKRLLWGRQKKRQPIIYIHSATHKWANGAPTKRGWVCGHMALGQSLSQKGNMGHCTWSTYWWRATMGSYFKYYIGSYYVSHFKNILMKKTKNNFL